MQAVTDQSLVTFDHGNIDLIGLASSISKDVEALLADGQIDRSSVVTKCLQLSQALETPREVMLRHCWAQTSSLAAINYGIATGLWTLMAKNGAQDQRATNLARSLNVDEILLQRIMRHLGAMGLVIETAEGTYKPTKYSLSLSHPYISSGYVAVAASCSAASMKFHKYSRDRNWQNPTDGEDTPLMHAYKTDMDLFAWLQSEGCGTQFNDLMICYQMGRKSWMSADIYPVQEHLINGAIDDSEAPFLVDIGGNIGHNLVTFKTCYPHFPGKLILQDLPSVIQQIKDLDHSIIRMEHNFNNEQPVIGARAYYMGSILHDWPELVCVRILTNIKKAMIRGYSKILVHESIMPESKAPWEITALDMMMLTLLSSQERTLTAWHHLIEEQAGLKIVKVWSWENTVESLIECELPPEQLPRSRNVALAWV
ncbi:hypothetical protein VE03_04786 [Pseudogymnoascus sp. 23342-1-I1]|nr:hypothetical protein VE03_04786 [Pseudogymnoascus sp. 23342-1-I1]